MFLTWGALPAVPSNCGGVAGYTTGVPPLSTRHADRLAIWPALPAGLPLAGQLVGLAGMAVLAGLVSSATAGKAG